MGVTKELNGLRGVTVNKKIVANKESYDFLDLNDIKIEDFEDGGRIKKSITYYLKKHLRTRIINGFNEVEVTKLLNTMFIDILNIIDFKWYQKEIINKVNFNGVILKGIYLTTLKSFIYNINRDTNVKEWVENYTEIINEMFIAMFSTKPMNREMLKKSLGIISEYVKDDYLNEISFDSDEENIYLKKITLVNDVISYIVNKSNDISLYDNGKLNGVGFLTYLSNDAIFFKKEQVKFENDKRYVIGVEFNSAVLSSKPELLFDVNCFVIKTYRLIEHIEKNKKLTINISEIDDNIRKYFNNENLTAFSFMNLFASGLLKISIIEKESYLINLSDTLRNGIPNCEEYIKELIKTLREYNDLSMENVNINIEK